MINKKMLKGYIDDVNAVFENHGTALTEEERKEQADQRAGKTLIDDDDIDCSIAGGCCCCCSGDGSIFWRIVGRRSVNSF